MEYLTHTLNLASIFVILTVSLNLILGYGGMASMAHAAFFCIGGYISAILTINLGCNFLLGIIVAAGATALVGGVLAAPFIKVQEEYLILFTIAFQMVVFHLMLSLYNISGGDSGIFGVPVASFFGYVADTPARFLPLTAVFLFLVYYVAYKITKSPFGRVLKGIREDERAVSSLGKNVLRFKVIIFMVGTGIAAAAGGVFAHYTRFISPAIGSLEQSILIIAMVVLGGTANLAGSALGAFLLILIPEILNFLPGASDFIVPLRGFIYGVLLILFMRFRPEGLIPEYFRWGHTKEIVRSPFLGNGDKEKQKRQPDKGPERTHDGPVLEVKDLSKSFGGLRAVDNFFMNLENGKITALVGPNGCGKTTAFNLVTGFLRPDGGSIRFKGEDITNLPAHKMPHIGIVRSWQDIRIFQGMTVLDNLMVARQNQAGESVAKLFLMPWRIKKEEQENIQIAFSYMDAMGLRKKGAEIAKNLSYAEQKLLAIGRLLATEAQILLLDEPSSGVDPNWVEQLMQIIKRLAASGKTICIVEHNLEVVKGVSDTVYFMAEGQKIAQGPAEELMANPKLGEIYFGI